MRRSLILAICLLTLPALGCQLVYDMLADPGLTAETASDNPLDDFGKWNE